MNRKALSLALAFLFLAGSIGPQAVARHLPRKVLRVTWISTYFDRSRPPGTGVSTEWYTPEGTRFERGDYVLVTVGSGHDAPIYEINKQKRTIRERTVSLLMSSVSPEMRTDVERATRGFNGWFKAHPPRRKVTRDTVLGYHCRCESTTTLLPPELTAAGSVKSPLVYSTCIARIRGYTVDLKTESWEGGMLTLRTEASRVEALTQAPPDLLTLPAGYRTLRPGLE